MKSINGEWARTNALCSNVDTKFIKAYRESERAGDLAYYLMGIDEQKFQSLICRFKNSKRNNSAQFEYPKEVIFAMKIRRWQREH